VVLTVRFLRPSVRAVLHASCPPQCVPSYVHVVPALQAANVDMLSWLAELRERQANSSGAAVLRSLASNITADLLAHLYVPGGGYYACMYPDEDYQRLVAVRSVVDSHYVARGLHAWGRGPGLPGVVGEGMAAFFRRELETRDWLRALSWDDDLNTKDSRPPGILRPDHGITGACVRACGVCVCVCVVLGRAPVMRMGNVWCVHRGV
jgi:hypothetical protein